MKGKGEQGGGIDWLAGLIRLVRLATLRLVASLAHPRLFLIIFLPFAPLSCDRLALLLVSLLSPWLACTPVHRPPPATLLLQSRARKLQSLLLSVCAWPP